MTDMLGILSLIIINVTEKKAAVGVYYPNLFFLLLVEVLPFPSPLLHQVVFGSFKSYISL